jgi:hypothetical protein
MILVVLSLIRQHTILTTSLSYFNKEKDTVLEVGAGPEGVVSFWSKAFSDVEQRYSQVEKEALGVVLACKKFRIYLVIKKFLLSIQFKINGS